MRGSKAAMAAEEQRCCLTLQHMDRGEQEGFWPGHGNKTPTSERHCGQNSFLIEADGRCASEVNKDCTSTCKYHLCLWQKLNQKLKCCETQLVPSGHEGTQQKWIACEIESQIHQNLLFSFPTESSIFLIELINFFFKSRMSCKTKQASTPRPVVSGLGCSLQQLSPQLDLPKWDSSPVEINGKIATFGHGDYIN